MVKKWIRLVALVGVLLVVLLAFVFTIFGGPGAMILPFSLPFLLVLLLVYSVKKTSVNQEDAPAQNKNGGVHEDN